MTPATIEARMAELTIQHLLEGHRAFDQAASELGELVEAAAAGRTLDAGARERIACLGRMLRDESASHMKKEEEILFPALEGFLPRDVGPLAVLRGEHHDLAALLRSLVESAEAAAAGDDARLAPALEAARGALQLVRNHFYKEERVLFPMVARFLSPARDEALAAQMRSRDAVSKEGEPR